MEIAMELTMTTDLKMLLAVSVLSLFQFMPYFMAYIKHWGISGIVSNRENMPTLPSWAPSKFSSTQVAIPAHLGQSGWQSRK